MVNALTPDPRSPSRERATVAILDLIEKLPVPHGGASAIDRSDRFRRPVKPDGRIVTACPGAHTGPGLTLAAFAAQTLSDDGLSGNPRFEQRAFWRHAFNVAAVAEFLNGRASSAQEPSTVFTAALLHDVGLLALNHLVPKAYARVRSDARRRCHSVILEEDVTLGIDRARAGARLVTRWGLPSNIIDAIRWHHCPPAIIGERTGHVALVALVQLADALCCNERFGRPDKRSEETQELLGSCLGVNPSADPAELRQIRARAAAWFDACAPALGITPHRDRGSQNGRQNASTRSTTDPDRLTSADVRRLSEAVTRFAARLSPGDGRPDTCAAIGRCCCEVLRLGKAVTFIADPLHAVCHCAVTEDGKTTAADATEIADSGQRISGAATALLTTIVPAPPLADPVRERYRRVFSGESQWMLPIVHDRTIRGGVLFDSSDLTGDGASGNPAIIKMLIALFGSAVAQVEARADLERSRDDSLAANQRHCESQEQSARDRSLSMIRAMAAGAAHELNTPLAVISGRAQVLTRDARDPDTRRAMDVIRTQSELCSKIVDQLIEYARPRTPRPVVLALRPWFDDFGTAWRASATELKPDLEIVLAEPALRVYVDPDQLGGILDAVLSNAVDALPSEDPRLIVNSPSAESDDTVIIAVEDNGHGMASDVLKHACDPFFSHRTAGRGRGLGLCIAQRLAEVNKGRLWLESAPNAGTTVYVELPSADFTERP